MSNMHRRSTSCPHSLSYYSFSQKFEALAPLPSRSKRLLNHTIRGPSYRPSTKPIFKSMETSVEDFLADKEPFRIAYPGVPLPLPYRSASIEDHGACTRLNRLMDEIPGILSSFNITPLSFLAAECWRTDNKRRRKIVSIQVEGEKAGIWRRAARMINEMFEENSLTNLQIEISNPAKRLNRLISHDPPPADAIATFDSIIDGLFKVVGRLDHRCLGFGLYTFGNLENPTPTIIIFVKEQAEYEWLNFLRSCEKEIRSAKLTVQIQPSSLRLGEAQGDLCPESKQNLHPEPINGSSLGTNDGGTGTLGAFLILEFPSGNTLCGLTCQHVVAPSNVNLAAKIHRDGLGEGDFMASEARMSVRYPSEMDILVSIKRCTKLLGDFKGDMATMTAGGTRYLRKIRRELAVATHLQENGGNLGKVLFSSGIRSGSKGCLNHYDYTQLSKSKDERTWAHEWCKAEECKEHDHGRMDWAIFDIPRHLFNINKAPADRDVKPPALNYCCGDNFTISDIAPIERGTWVCKSGRTTGVTSGWVGSYHHFGRWVDKYDKNAGESKDVFVTWTKDWVIFPYEPHFTGFSQRGDSGSCLVDERGRIVALLTGGVDTGGQSITLVKDIGTVFADIEAKTGSKVRLSQSRDLGLLDQLTNFVMGFIASKASGVMYTLSKAA